MHATEPTVTCCQTSSSHPHILITHRVQTHNAGVRLRADLVLVLDAQIAKLTKMRETKAARLAAIRRASAAESVE